MIDATPSATPRPVPPVATVTSPEAPSPPADSLPAFAGTTPIVDVSACEPPSFLP